MAKVIVYTDFDGTITKQSGSETVFTEFYQSLLSGYIPKVKQNYKGPALLPPEAVQGLFEKKFGLFNEAFDYKQKDSEILMTAEAVIFFHELLKQPDVSINIATRNRKDYIQALFRYQGFSEDEISKLNIMDSGGKYYDVYNNLNTFIVRPATIYLLDDDFKDCSSMAFATATAGYSTEVRKINNAVGTFEWLTYLKEILSTLEMAPAPPSAVPTSEIHTVASEELLSTTSVSTAPVNPLMISRTDSEEIEGDGSLSTEMQQENEDVQDDQEDSNLIPFIGAAIFLVVALGLPVFGVGVVASLVLASCVVIGAYLINSGIEVCLNALEDSEEDVVDQDSGQSLQALGGKVSAGVTREPVGHFPSLLSSRTTVDTQPSATSSTMAPRN